MDRVNNTGDKEIQKGLKMRYDGGVGVGVGDTWTRYEIRWIRRWGYERSENAGKTGGGQVTG